MKHDFLAMTYIIVAALTAMRPSIKDVEIFQGGGGLKFRCCKILEGRNYVNQGQNSDMGRRVSNMAQKIPTSFMDGPKVKKCGVPKGCRGHTQPCNRTALLRCVGLRVVADVIEHCQILRIFPYIPNSRPFEFPSVLK